MRMGAPALSAWSRSCAFSKEVGHLDRLKRSLALYRLVFGQPRQEDLLTHLSDRLDLADAEAKTAAWRISLEPPEVERDR